MSDNDPKDRKDKEDLTRIEDLSDFFHNEEDEDFSDLDSHSEDNSEFEDMATDPDMELPPEFSSQDDSTDFSALEDDDSPPSLPEESTQSYNLEDSGFDSDDNSFDSEENDFGSSDNNFDSEDNDFDSEENNFDSSENDFDSEDNSFETSENEFDSDEFGGDEFQENDFGSEDTSEEENSFDAGFKDDTDQDDFSTNNTELEEDDIAISEEATDFGADNSEFDTEIEPSTEENDFLESQELPEQNEEIQEPLQKTEIPKFEEEKPYKAPESFQELQVFSKNMAYGNMAREGNPPFSIILKDIKYQEDLEDIVILLKEYKIINEESEEQAKESLQRGSYLIPRLGEYAAITLCHKLRRFQLNILMGLTEEIHPAKSYSSDDRGLATKNNIFNNKKHNWNFDNQNYSIEDILTSTTSSLDGHEVLEYISIGTELTVMNANELKLNTIEENTSEQIDSLKHIYNDLLNKLKASALDKKANAIIGVNYQTTPISNQLDHDITTQYQIVCSGSFVWVSKR